MTKGGIVVGGKRGDADNSEAELRRALEGSLKRLQVEQVELYYIHRRDWSIEIEDVTETLAKFKSEGKIGGFGFSKIAPSSLRRAHAVHPVTAVQNEYSYGYLILILERCRPARTRSDFCAFFSAGAWYDNGYYSSP